MKASLIIPTYNRAGLLQKTLNSVLSQKYCSSDFEVIIIDDGSTDNTAKIVKTFNDSLNIKYYRVNHYGFQVSKLRNIGIEMANGEIIIFVDSGLILKDDYIQEHLLYHQKSKYEIALIGKTYCLHSSLNDDYIVELLSNINKETFFVLQEKENYQDIRIPALKYFNNDLCNSDCPWFYFVTANASVKRKSLLKVGLFDENFKSWGIEDLELGYRLHVAKIKFVFGSKAISIHHPHERNLITNKKSEENNASYFLAKHNDVNIEFFTIKRELYFPIIFSKFKEKLKKRDLYKKKKELFEFVSQKFNPRNKQLLLCGASNKSMLKWLDCKYAIEAEEFFFEKLKSCNLSYHILNQIGFKLHFENKKFHLTVLTDIYLFLATSWFIEVLKEIIRISKNTIFIIPQNEIDYCTIIKKRLLLITKYTYSKYEIETYRQNNLNCDKLFHIKWS